VTETEAIKFLQNRRREMVSTRHLSIGEVISRFKDQSIAVMFFGLMLIVFAPINISKVQSNYWLCLKIFELVIGLTMMGLSVWRFIRLRQVRRALGYATAGSSRLSDIK
jgi:hypothetical protein